MDAIAEGSGDLELESELFLGSNPVRTPEDVHAHLPRGTFKVQLREVHPKRIKLPQDTLLEGTQLDDHPLGIGTDDDAGLRSFTGLHHKFVGRSPTIDHHGHQVSDFQGFREGGNESLGDGLTIHVSDGVPGLDPGSFGGASHYNIRDNSQRFRLTSGGPHDEVHCESKPSPGGNPIPPRDILGINRMGRQGPGGSNKTHDHSLPHHHHHRFLLDSRPSPTAPMGLENPVTTGQGGGAEKSLPLSKGVDKYTIHERIGRRLLDRRPARGQNGLDGRQTCRRISYVGRLSLGVHHLPVLEEGQHVLPFGRIHRFRCVRPDSR